MNRWFNPSHPQTLQAAVILGYLGAVFGLLGGGPLFLGALSLPFLIGLGVGAFASANNKRWGYFLLTGCAVVIAASWVLGLVSATTGISILVPSISRDLLIVLRLMSLAVFPVALALATIHPHSREYQRIWFE
ncbi:MAG: hypothetical protein AAGD35_14505 [Actinomycetota bacterium]